jgi:hypothetical protein
MERIRRLVREGAADVVLSYAVDRLARNQTKYRSSQVTEWLGRVGEERRVGSQGCVNVGEDLVEGG